MASLHLLSALSRTLHNARASARQCCCARSRNRRGGDPTGSIGFSYGVHSVLYCAESRGKRTPLCKQHNVLRKAKALQKTRLYGPISSPVWNHCLLYCCVTESKSKRTPLRKKYKILRKVKEHQKKKAKEEKKRGNRARPEKDPGIPNSWPLKEQELAAMEARRQMALQEKEQQREARRAARVSLPIPPPLRNEAQGQMPIPRHARSSPGPDDCAS